VEQHEREQAEGLGLLGKEIAQAERQAKRVPDEVAADERPARRREIALVEQR
jgi:hypothetical protein